MNPIIETLLRGSLISLAGLLIALAAQKSSALTRNRILTWTLLCLAVLPILVFSGLRWHVIPTGSSDSAVTVPLPVSPIPIQAHATEPPTALSEPSLLPDTNVRRSLSWPSILLGLYLTGIFISWLPSLAAMSRLRRLRKCSAPCTDHRLHELASAIAPSLQAQLRLSSSNHAPMTWGLFRPIVLLPESALDWSDARLNAVLNHEYAHIQRHDGVVMAIAQGVQSLYWPQPLVWHLVKRWRTLTEFACDEQALKQGSKSEDYAAALYDLAKEQSTGTPIALPMATGHALEARVKAVLTPKRNVRSKGAVILGALILTVCLAAIAAEERPIETKRFQLSGLITVAPQPFFENQGIAFPDKTSITYNRADGQLSVTHTPESLDEIARILAVNGLTAPKKPLTQDEQSSKDPRIHTIDRTLLLTLIPDIDLPQATLTSAIVKLKELSVKYLPEGRKPAKILIDEISIDQKNASTLTTVHDLHIPAAPLRDTLWYIAHRWNLDFHLAPDSVTIGPAKAGFRNASALSLSLAPGVKVPPGFIRGDVRAFLKSKGIQLEGTRPFATFDRSTHHLHVETSYTELVRLYSLLTAAQEQYFNASFINNKERSHVEEALRTIILPEVRIQDATPAEAVDTIRGLIAIHDKRDLPEDEKSVQISIPPKSLTERVSLKLSSAPASVCLEYLAELMNAKLAFKSNVAVFIPDTEDDQEQEESSNFIRVVDEAWELPVPQAKSDKDNEDAGELTNITQKLNQTVIPDFKLNDVTLEEAISEMNKLTITHDLRDVPQNRKGINTLVDRRKIRAAKPEALQKRISLDLPNTSAFKALQEVTKQVGVAYRLEPYAVVIVPTNDDASALFTRSYAVTAEMAKSKLSGKDYFKRFDIKFPEGATAYFIPSKNELVARNTASQLDRIGQIVRTTNTQARRNELRQVTVPKFAVTDATLPEAVAQLRSTVGANHKEQIKIIVDMQSLQSKSAQSLKLRATMNLQDTSLTDLFDQLGEQFGVAIRFELQAVKITAAP